MEKCFKVVENIKKIEFWRRLGQVVTKTLGPGRIMKNLLAWKFQCYKKYIDVLLENENWKQSKTTKNKEETNFRTKQSRFLKFYVLFFVEFLLLFFCKISKLKVNPPWVNVTKVNLFDSIYLISVCKEMICFLLKIILFSSRQICSNSRK